MAQHNINGQDGKENYSQTIFNWRKRPNQPYQNIAKKDKLEALVKNSGISTSNKPNDKLESLTIHMKESFQQKASAAVSYSELVETPCSDDESQAMQLDGIATTYKPKKVVTILPSHLTETLQQKASAANVSYSELADALCSDDESQPMQFYDMNSGQVQNGNYERRLAALEVTQNTIANDLKRIHKYLKEIRDCVLKNTKHKVHIPIDGSLDDLERKITEDSQFACYLQSLLADYKPTLTACPNSFGLARVFTDNVLKEYNWDGSHNRKPFKNLEALNKILFDAWKGDCFAEFSTYIKSIRAQMYTARVKRFQREKPLSPRNETLYE